MEYTEQQIEDAVERYVDNMETKRLVEIVYSYMLDFYLNEAVQEEVEEFMVDWKVEDVE